MKENQEKEDGETQVLLVEVNTGLEGSCVCH